MGGFKLEKINDKVWELEKCDLLKQKSKYLLYSQLDKKVEINNVLDKINFKYHTNFIIFGIKNIELISEIYRRKTSYSTMIILEITNDDYIQLEGEHSQLDFMSDKLVNLVLGNKDNLMFQLKSVLTSPVRLYNLRNIQIISMPYVKSTYPEEVHEITKVILDSFSTTVSSCGNDVQDILMGMDNYINNWDYTFKGVDHIYFEKLYKGKTAIIVGAGPSIDKSIEYLKNIKGKALILCADAAMDVLLDEGIVPDIIASIERTEATICFYKREQIPQEIVYVGANQVQGPILDKMSRIVLTGRTGDAFFREFNKSIGLENLNIGNNVSHILVAFAQFLGFSTVIFTGLDLAYPQGVTHAKRTLNNFTDKMKASYISDMILVKGQNGEMLETKEYFMHTRVWIEDFILVNKECTYINASEGGANINGAKNLNIADAIEEYCTDTEVLPFNNYYDVIRSEHSIDQKSTTKKAIEFFNDLVKFYERVYKIAEENYDILCNEKESGILVLMEEQRESFREIWTENPAGSFILQSINIKYNRDIHSFPMYLEKEDEIRMKKVNMDYYDLLKKVTQRVNKDLKLYIESLESHLALYNKEGEN